MLNPAWLCWEAWMNVSAGIPVTLGEFLLKWTGVQGVKMRVISYSSLASNKDPPAANGASPAFLLQLFRGWLYTRGSSVVTATLWWAFSELLQLPAPGRLSRNLQPAAGESGGPLLLTAPKQLRFSIGWRRTLSSSCDFLLVNFLF